MTVLDRPMTAYAPRASAPIRTAQDTPTLRCVICHKPFDFARGQTAVVLEHIAYGYDFAHPGTCLDQARESIFVEPGYDRPAFSTNGRRARVLGVQAADHWQAVLPAAPQQILAGQPVTFEPLLCWAMVEYHDGSRRLEGLVRSSEWLNEPGGAEFPEARRGLGASLGYVLDEDRSNPARLAEWDSTLRARYRGVARRSR